MLMHLSSFTFNFQLFYIKKITTHAYTRTPCIIGGTNIQYLTYIYRFLSYKTLAEFPTHRGLLRSVVSKKMLVTRYLYMLNVFNSTRHESFNYVS
jgi:hypothetical protein